MSKTSLIVMEHRRATNASNFLSGVVEWACSGSEAGVGLLFPEPVLAYSLNRLNERLKSLRFDVISTGPEFESFAFVAWILGTAEDDDWKVL